MTAKEQNLLTRISDELLERYPDQKPKIAELKGNSIIYELEEHGNYTYYQVKYHLLASGELKIDWESAGLTVY